MNDERSSWPLPAPASRSYGVDTSGKWSSYVDNEQAAWASRVYHSDPTFGACRDVLHGYLFGAEGMRFTWRDADSGDMSEAFQEHVATAWTDFAKDALDALLKFGYVPVTWRKLRTDPFAVPLVPQDGTYRVAQFMNEHYQLTLNHVATAHTNRTDRRFEGPKATGQYDQTDRLLPKQKTMANARVVGTGPDGTQIVDMMGVHGTEDRARHGIVTENDADVMRQGTALKEGDIDMDGSAPLHPNGTPYVFMLGNRTYRVTRTGKHMSPVVRCMNDHFTVEQMRQDLVDASFESAHPERVQGLVKGGRVSLDELAENDLHDQAEAHFVAQRTRQQNHQRLSATHIHLDEEERAERIRDDRLSSQRMVYDNTAGQTLVAQRRRRWAPRTLPDGMQLLNPTPPKFDHQSFKIVVEHTDALKCMAMGIPYEWLFSRGVVKRDQELMNETLHAGVLPLRNSLERILVETFQLIYGDAQHERLLSDLFATVTSPDETSVDEDQDAARETILARLQSRSHISINWPLPNTVSVDDILRVHDAGVMETATKAKLLNARLRLGRDTVLTPQKEMMQPLPVMSADEQFKQRVDNMVAQRTAETKANAKMEVKTAKMEAKAAVATSSAPAAATPPAKRQRTGSASKSTKK